MASILRTQSVTTSWAALPDEKGGEVSILNNTGADLLIADSTETADAPKVVTLKDGQSVGLLCSVSAKEFSISAAADAAGVQIIVSR